MAFSMAVGVMVTCPAPAGAQSGEPAPTDQGLAVRAASVQSGATGGDVLDFGTAPNKGSLAGKQLAAPITAAVSSPDGAGYWLVGADGGVFGFGDARYFGSMSGRRLAAPVVGVAATKDGGGYWLVGADGGVFGFGDAHYYGSLGGRRLAAPLTGMAMRNDGLGYWLVAADGGVFCFGDAPYHGSAAGRTLAQPVVAILSRSGGYWLVEGNKNESRANVFPPGLVAELNARSGVISASVLDLNSGELYEYRLGQQDVTASIVKVEILATLLSQAQSAGRALTANEQSLATSMIEDSDNSAATSLWDDVGGAPSVRAFDQSIGMASTSPAPAWGYTVTTADDQITLLRHVVLANPPLSPPSRAYILGLMESVVPAQAWGVSAGAVPGTTIALKNGWLPVGQGWEMNSIGWLHGSGRNYLIAVLTSGDPSAAYGVGSISMVATSAWNALGGV